MWPDRVSNPGPLTYESGALPTALRVPATAMMNIVAYVMLLVSKFNMLLNMFSYSNILHL